MESHGNNFGARLKALIERKGIAQLEFAKDFGLSESQLYNWLKRKEPPLAKHWPKLSSYFGVSTSFLTAGIPENVESLASAVGEPPAVYGTADAETSRATLVRMLEFRFGEILRRAGDSVARLGWVYEQFDQHVYRPALQWQNAESKLPKEEIQMQAQRSRSDSAVSARSEMLRRARAQADADEAEILSRRSPKNRSA